MHLPALEILHRNMIAAGVLRIGFEFRNGPALFRVLFLSDLTPFDLLFGVPGTTYSFVLQVDAAYDLKIPIPRSAYSAICDALGLRYDPANPFSVADFFRRMNGAIPGGVAGGFHADPLEIARYSRDVEEADKIYFVRWRDNTSRGDNVTNENLAKTKRIFGWDTFDYCRRRNLSSCWTDIPPRIPIRGIPPF